MAEYYPLLAKAVGSLPNSTPETRRIVYERARKALIGQLRTYHPPVPEQDIEEQSLDLDRAIERLEGEIASAPRAAPEPTTDPSSHPPPPPPAAPPPPVPSGALGSATPRKPIAPLRPRVPRPPTIPATEAGSDAAVTGAEPPELKPPEPRMLEPGMPEPKEAAEPPAPERSALKLPEPKREIAGVPIPPPAPTAPIDGSGEPAPKPRLEAQRPIAPQPPVARVPKRRMWIIPVGIAAVFLLVGIAAWKLRVKPETVARTPSTQPQQDTGKIADRVGGKAPSEDKTEPQPSQAPPPETPTQPAPSQQAAAPGETPAPAPAETPAPAQQAAPAAANPEVPVAYRAALLVEAPDSPSKVQTFPGTVVWKLNNVNNGPGDSVSLSVEADIDLPDDKMKATVIFEKNTDPSLPASHTIKVRFAVAPGSFSGDIKQINVPQMRRESNSDGEPLAGVTVPVIQNSFLVGLSPGNAETANLRLVADLPWIDLPMLLASGRIAKLTFEKGAAGQRDMAEAMSYWQKP